MDKKERQYQKSIEQARWIMSQYAEMEEMDGLTEKENIAAELIADIEIYLESLGYDLENIKSIKMVSKDLIKQGRPF